MKYDEVNNVLFNSIVWEWVERIADNDVDGANNIIIEYTSKPPFSFSMIEEELCVKLSKYFNSISEFEDYLKYLDEDYYSAVEVIISKNVFDKMYDIFKREV